MRSHFLFPSTPFKLEKEFFIVDTHNHLSENSKRPKLMTGSSWAKWNNAPRFVFPDCRNGIPTLLIPFLVPA